MIRWAIPLLVLAVAAALFLVLRPVADRDASLLVPEDGMEEGAAEREATTLKGAEGAKERVAAEAARAAAEAAAHAKGPAPVVPKPRAARKPVPFQVVVVGADGRVARSARVRIYQDGRLVFEGRTDAEGRVIGSLPPGRYEVHVVDAEGAVGPPSQLIVDGAQAEPVRIELGTGPALRIRFVQAEGSPPVQHVHLLTAANQQTTGRERLAVALASVMPDATGLAEFTGVPPGRYELIAQLTSEILLRMHHEHASEDLRPVPIPEGVTLKGKVTEGWEGRPIPDVQVDFGGVIGATRVEVRVVSDLEGRLEVAVPRGRYASVTARAEGWLSWPPRHMSAETGKEYARGVSALGRIQQGLAAEIHIPLTRHDGPVLVGRVIDPEGAALPGITVVVSEARYGRSVWHMEIVTDEDGRFEVTELRPGSYRARVDADGWRTSSDLSFAVAPDLREPVDVEVAVVPAHRLAGHVVQPDGRPAPGARVWLSSVYAVTSRRPGESDQYEAFADERGAFELGGLGLGTTHIVRAAWGDFQTDPSTVSAGRAGTQNLRLTLRPAPRLRIRVVEPGSGRVVPWAGVSILPEGPPAGREIGTHHCDAGGELVIRAILGAKWTVAASSWWHRPAAPIAVDLSEAREEFALVVELDPGLAFAGQVLDGAGEPVVAKVRVGGRAEGEISNRDRTRSTDGRGFFRLTGFAYGTYTLTVTAAGYRSQRNSELHGGEEHLEIRLVKNP